MPVKPKAAIDKFERVKGGWGSTSPNKSYAGTALEEYKVVVQTSYDIRLEIAKLEEQVRMKKDERDEIDRRNLEKTERIIEGIIGEEGRNSAIYQAIGYVRKSERKTGLTRKKSAAKPK